MQTFITHDDPIICAKNLDFKRLGKQRLEAVIILKIINNMKFPGQKKTGWMNHPAIKMWINYEESLKYYTNVMIKEWISRGYKNTMPIYETYCEKMPEWFYYKPIQDSHKISLYRKLPEFYNFLMTDYLKNYLDIGYIWFTMLEEDEETLIKNDPLKFFDYVRKKNRFIFNYSFNKS